MRYKLVALAIFVGMLAILSQAYFRIPTCHEGQVLPVFSPSDSERVLDLIDSAKNEIKLEVYEFSSRLLADKLIEAEERGVSVKVILEPSVYQNNDMQRYLVNHGIEVNWASDRFHNTHAKFMVVDGEVVLVGSMNWSENSMRYNREASVIVTSKDLSSEFERIFDTDFQ
jgi:phosphatidylserine/phosphatidylglycerophosphate/cardiolipin synthase-like enzyme